jgi:hypothetical protein
MQIEMKVEKSSGHHTINFTARIKKAIGDFMDTKYSPKCNFLGFYLKGLQIRQSMFL